MELLAQGARFYELLGYVLAVLSAGILAAGVIWSLRVYVREKYRTFFLVATLAALSTICGGVLLQLVLTQPLSPALFDAQPPQQIDRRTERFDPTDRVQQIEVQKIEVHVNPDGTVLYQSQATTVERLVPHLRREHPNKRLHVNIRVDAETKLVVVTTVIGELQQQDVEQFTFNVGDQKNPVNQ